MKILVISAAFPPMRAGEADHALHLCQHLADRGIDVHVLTTKRNNQANSHSFIVHPIMADWGWSSLFRFARVVKRCSPDSVLLIYTPRDYNYNDMITFAPTITKAILRRARFVTQFETSLIGPQGSIFARAIRKGVAACVGDKQLDYVFGTLLCRSDRLILLSEQHLMALSSHFPHLNSKGTVIPPPPLLRMSPTNNGASRQCGREALGAKSDDFLIAYYGYIYPEKGIETLFEAFRIITGQRTNTKLVMIGGKKAENHHSSYVDRIDELARSLGIHSKVIWTGEYASESDEASFYLRGVDACVFPFKYGVTLNRSSVAVAAAHGLPIITTKGKFLESAFLDQENLLLCPPEEPDALAMSIATLMDDQALRERLGMGSLKLATEYYSWQKALDQTIAALNQ